MEDISKKSVVSALNAVNASEDWVYNIDLTKKHKFDHTPPHDDISLWRHRWFMVFMYFSGVAIGFVVGQVFRVF